MHHPQRHPRSCWTGLRATWSVWRCSYKGVLDRWHLKVSSNPVLFYENPMLTRTTDLKQTAWGVQAQQRQEISVRWTDSIDISNFHLSILGSPNQQNTFLKAQLNMNLHFLVLESACWDCRQVWCRTDDRPTTGTPMTTVQCWSISRAR